MSRVSYLDLPALASLMQVDRQLRAHAGRLVLLRPSPSVRQILKLCGVGNRRPLHLAVKPPSRPTVNGPEGGSS